jgi:hypothetical protein
VTLSSERSGLEPEWFESCGGVFCNYTLALFHDDLLVGGLGTEAVDRAGWPADQD